METTQTEVSTPPRLAFKNILVPVDFSAPSNAALQSARLLARHVGSAVRLLHVVELSPIVRKQMRLPHLGYSEGEIGVALNSLAALAAIEQTDEKLTYSTAVRIGVAAHEIVAAAREMNIDLIVVAAHGHTGWKHFSIGSTADQVARTAPCSVLVVRAKECDLESD